MQSVALRVTYLRNNVNCSDSRADRHVAIGAFHRHYQTKVRQRGFRLDLSFVTAFRVHYLTELDELYCQAKLPTG